MLPLIGKDVLSMDDKELSEFIGQRRAARLVTPGRSTKNKTVASLAKTWGVTPESVINATKKELENAEQSN